MTIPVAPTKMSGTDPKKIGGIWSFIHRFNALVDWIISLSPVGALLHDTGFTTLTAPSGATVRARRIGKRIEIKWEHSSTIATGGSVDIFTDASPIPAEWRPPHHTIPAAMHGTGARLMVGALTNAGRVYAYNKDTSNIANHQGYITFTVA